MTFPSFGESYRRRKQTWQAMQRSSLLILLSFAFLLFCTIGLLTTVGIPRHLPAQLYWAVIVTYGLFAVAYAYVSIRIHWVLIFAIMPLQFVANWWFHVLIGRQPLLPAVTNSEMGNRIDWGMALATILITIGYVLALILMGREGKRYFKIHTEVQLASEIHRTLVPLISLRFGGFEMYGLSLPSGEVGGDLVDAVVLENGCRWIAYVADVSGHGVSSGVLMAMLKSATRMSLRQNHAATKMLDEVNEVFYSLKAPNSFATFAAVSCTEMGGLEALIAGHLPILHCDGRAVHELDTPGLPVGILPDADFRAVSLDLKEGELLAIVTDGLTEVFNKKGMELESDYIKKTLLEECARPLDQIANSLLAQANAWGPRSDDQSLLLVRRVPSGPD